MSDGGGVLVVLKSSLTFKARRASAKASDRLERCSHSPPRRYLRGEEVGNSVLTEGLVRRMLELKRPGVGVKKLKSLLSDEGFDVEGISYQTMCGVLYRDNWKHLRCGR